MVWVGYEPEARCYRRAETSAGRLHRSGGVGEEPLRPYVADLCSAWHGGLSAEPRGSQG